MLLIVLNVYMYSYVPCMCVCVLYVCMCMWVCVCVCVYQAMRDECEELSKMEVQCVLVSCQVGRILHAPVHQVPSHAHSTVCIHYSYVHRFSVHVCVPTSSIVKL